MKRLISSNASEMLQMDAKTLKNSIKASEGRVVVSENFATREAFVADITNAEIARSFGADLILLNGVDVLRPYISGIHIQDEMIIKELRKLVGRPIGVNLEPIDQDIEMLEVRDTISSGRHATLETLKEAQKLGFDFICLTGNPGTGVSNDSILKTITLAKKYFSGMIIAGKMHASGTVGSIVDLETVDKFIDAGTDVVLVPAVGTVPGFSSDELSAIVNHAHTKDALVMSAIGTSQESSDSDVIKTIAIANKICGVDMQHIGDAGYAGIAPVENIYELSKAIRGMRHTVSMMARSIVR